MLITLIFIDEDVAEAHHIINIGQRDVDVTRFAEKMLLAARRSNSFRSVRYSRRPYFELLASYSREHTQACIRVAARGGAKIAKIAPGTTPQRILLHVAEPRDCSHRCQPKGP